MPNYQKYESLKEKWISENPDSTPAQYEAAIKAKMLEFNSDPFVSTPEEFAKFTAEDAEKWGRVVKAAGIKLE